MTGQHDLDFHLGRSPHGRVEIIQFEPEQDTIAIRPVGTVGDRAVMVLDLERVELQHEFAVSRQAFVLGTPMGAFESQQALIPAAAGLDIGDGDERLWSHVR